jgi:hypothetical protein
MGKSEIWNVSKFRIYGVLIWNLKWKISHLNSCEGLQSKFT